ncbi:MAG TPA: response regulator [Candidatus Nanoarchaeia archaeon]|nr:response regulator [Candidatus Nanoarchaeia archaeon]
MSKILVIEQDSFFGNVIQQKLKESGYEAVVTNSSVGALEQTHLVKPDLLVLDMEISNGDPFDVLKGKQAEPALKDIPTIIISQSGDLAEIKKALNLGVSDYLVKAQLNLDEFITKVKNQLNKVHSTTKEGGGSLAGKKVMWVEDDQFLSDLISRKLNHQGCRLLYSRTGEDALKILETETPDIIILDLLLPGISGFDVLEKAKADPRVKDVPVVILSNFSQNNEVERAKKLGATKFLIKASIVLDDLVHELVAILAAKK